MGYPSGTILFWSGTIANIPTGWVLCNGSNGTPDLRNKFVKGAAAGNNPGSTGGAATHTHDNHASRTHSGTAVSDHAAMTHSGMAVANHTTLAVLNSVRPIVVTGNHSVTQPSQHAAQSHSVTQPSAHAARTHSTNNHEPAYFALAFIMKT